MIITRLLMWVFRMRCKELTRGYGLPDKQFSNKTRCPHCCLEWARNTELKVIKNNMGIMTKVNSYSCKNYVD